MIPKKIICVWIGTFESENELYQNYLNFDYKTKNESISKFGIDTGLKYYDEDFMESWWFDKLELNKLIEYKDDLLDSEYFFDELIAKLKTKDLTCRNSISFLFGESGEHPTNEMLFDYNGTNLNNKPIEFVFKKEYKTK